VHVKIYQFACAHVLPVRNEIVHGANERLTLKSHKAQKNAKNVYTGLGGSHMANTGRGLTSRGKVEEVVN